jgi:hypothetical protein
VESYPLTIKVRFLSGSMTFNDKVSESNNKVEFL